MIDTSEFKKDLYFFKWIIIIYTESYESNLNISSLRVLHKCWTVTPENIGILRLICSEILSGNIELEIEYILELERCHNSIVIYSSSDLCYNNSYDIGNWIRRANMCRHTHRYKQRGLTTDHLLPNVNSDI